MFKISLVDSKNDTLRNLRDQNRELKFLLDQKERTTQNKIKCKEIKGRLLIEEAKNDIRKEMGKALIESDIERVKAEEQARCINGLFEYAKKINDDLIKHNRELISLLKELKVESRTQIIK